MQTTDRVIKLNPNQVDQFIEEQNRLNKKDPDSYERLEKLNGEIQNDLREDYNEK